MKDIFLSPYDPAATEQKIYDVWEQSGFFNPDICVEKGMTSPDAPHFSMVLPPPNVTGTLHLGHAFEDTLQDIAVRFHRMRGDRTLWIPGTDHAPIATESKVAKNLEKEEGKRKRDFTRAEFIEKVEKFAKESHDTIVNQVRRVGASLDWSREAFTFDAKRSLAVRTAFTRMYDEGIIYRGHRIINWDPKGQTTISDDEIVYKEEKTKLYYLKYGPFTIATARPETKFGDKYVVMHPDDSRYAQFAHGQTIELEWINGPITATVIKDDAIDMAFGTGAMTITPWHSVVDFDMAERHKLDKEQIIDMYGKLLPIAGEFSGMKISDAREKIVEKLKTKGLVEKEEEYVHNIPTAERTGGVIEPQIMNQWFVNVTKEFPYPHDTLPYVKKGEIVTLKKLMLSAVESGAVRIMPENFEKIYRHWITNLRDWCISRQIWYGHRIPVWYRATTGKTYCGTEAPQGDGWEQDPDTLDTWFSSGTWTFSTMGWPQKTTDLETYHPTSFMCPGYEILPLWVSRMILMSTFLVGEIPFEEVLFHGIVRDSKGQKFSKSQGNGIDPIDVIGQFGADALRMALIVGVSAGSDSKFDMSKVKAYKLFANKIWNITRFVLSNSEDSLADASETTISATDQALLDEFATLTGDITADMENYRFYLAAEKLYHYLWHRFADEIIEEAKADLKSDDAATAASSKYMLRYILETSLKLLHPFMPFITEEIWSHIPRAAGERDLLMISAWPKSE
jgi:valyl-tRNA synthetase